MYDGATTTVRSAAGLTEEIQGRCWTSPRLSTQPILYSHYHGQADGGHQEGRTMGYAVCNDIVLSRQNHRELEDDLEIWRNVLERRGLKVSWSKTEYLNAGDVNDGEELELQGEKLKRAKNFNYLGSTVSSDGRCEEDVRRKVQAGWMSWKKVSGVLCDRKLSARVKGKMYKSVVKPAMLYGMETVAVTERQVEKMEVAVLKMVRYALVVTRKFKTNEYVRGTGKSQS